MDTGNKRVAWRGSPEMSSSHGLSEALQERPYPAANTRLWWIPTIGIISREPEIRVRV